MGVDDIKGKYVTRDEEKEGLTKFTKIIKELKKQIESSSIKDAHDQGYGETQAELVRFKQDLYKATWYGTAAWRKDADAWKELQATLKADDDFKCKAVLMTQKEEGENDAIHVHENVLPEFYQKYLSLFLGDNNNKQVIRYAKFIAGGNSSVQVCIKPMRIDLFAKAIEHHMAALKEQNAMLRSELEKKSKKGRVEKATKLSVSNTAPEKLTLDQKMQMFGGRRTGKKKGKKNGEKRRMAQREFSSRRDSPVMVRLLEKIMDAQDD